MKPDAPLKAAEAAQEAPKAPQKASEAPAAAREAPMEALPEAPEVPLDALDAVPEAPEQVLERTDLPGSSSETVAALATAPDAPPSAPAAQPESGPVSAQTIANAYGNYTQKSFEQTMSFFEQLAGARSFNRAFALQAEFVQQACRTFVTESQRIRELHSELAKQRLKNLEGLVTGRNVTRST